MAKSRLRVRKRQAVADASGRDFIQCGMVGDQEIRYWTVDLNRCPRVCKLDVGQVASSNLAIGNQYLCQILTHSFKIFCDYFIGNLEGH